MLQRPIGRDKPLQFYKFYLMRSFEKLIPWLGSTNLSTTGFGEKQHRQVKKYKEMTNRCPEPGKITGQVT